MWGTLELPGCYSLNCPHDFRIRLKPSRWFLPPIHPTHIVFWSDLTYPTGFLVRFSVSNWFSGQNVGTQLVSRSSSCNPIGFCLWLKVPTARLALRFFQYFLPTWHHDPITAANLDFPLHPHCSIYLFIFHQDPHCPIEQQTRSSYAVILTSN